MGTKQGEDSLKKKNLYLKRVTPITMKYSPGWPSTNQIKSNQIKSSNQSNQSNQMLVFEERGKPEYPEKNLSEQSREPTNSVHTSRSRVENQQTQSTYDAGSGNRTRDTLVEGEHDHHCANPAPHSRSRVIMSCMTAVHDF